MTVRSFPNRSAICRCESQTVSRSSVTGKLTCPSFDLNSTSWFSSFISRPFHCVDSASTPVDFDSISTSRKMTLVYHTEDDLAGHPDDGEYALDMD